MKICASVAIIHRKGHGGKGVLSEIEVFKNFYHFRVIGVFQWLKEYLEKLDNRIKNYSWDKETKKHQRCDSLFA
jgi:hypothetical protein